MPRTIPRPGETQNTTGGGPSAHQSVTLTNVTGSNLGAGDHTIRLACNQNENPPGFGVGDIVYDTTYLSAVVLGPG